MAHTDYGTDTWIGPGGAPSGGVAHTDYGTDTRIGLGVGTLHGTSLQGVNPPLTPPRRGSKNKNN
ncbi:hypothetical protein [Okeania sp. KiyG1]|uniref:hypothetical protein n=1 Tax=Okeania sp. KiyG1 TaxID=2720165 RepID=UPI001920CB22|nr:hypothetical protein [Okeania sp. KiyG1]